MGNGMQHIETSSRATGDQKKSERGSHQKQKSKSGSETLPTTVLVPSFFACETTTAHVPHSSVYQSSFFTNNTTLQTRAKTMCNSKFTVNNKARVPKNTSLEPAYLLLPYHAPCQSTLHENQTISQKSKNIILTCPNCLVSISTSE
jgi:hypothetical protein